MRKYGTGCVGVHADVVPTSRGAAAALCERYITPIVWNSARVIPSLPYWTAREFGPEAVAAVPSIETAAGTCVCLFSTPTLSRQTKTVRDSPSTKINPNLSSIFSRNSAEIFFLASDQDVLDPSCNSSVSSRNLSNNPLYLANQTRHQPLWN